ncbi:hypothetical protein JEQ12_007838 [Ovis aries]|uniref:Uncharacterized protein n=1 Tax=Ovis aries TaxID=9940 RepID=A0A835ZQ23_SHEEP|nr:hypothetical protein JEQ12_007838 [Ovis aries]
MIQTEPVALPGPGDYDQSPRCIENYTGARCEEVFLPSSSIQTKSDLFTAFMALTVLLGTLILGALYFLCRKGHLQRASSVQYDINLVETSSTSVHHGLHCCKGFSLVVASRNYFLVVVPRLLILVASLVVERKL